MSKGDPNASVRTESANVARGHLALFVAQFFFGLFPVFGVIALDRERGCFDPFALAAWRIAFGGLVMGGIAFAVHRRSWMPRREDLPRFLACALLGIIANQGLFLYGLDQSEAVDAGLVICLIPVWTWLIAVAVRQERFVWKRGLGVAIAFAGTIPLTEIDGNGYGNLLMAANTLCYSVYLVIAKPLTAKYPPLVVLAWVYLFSMPAVVGLLWGRSPLPASPELWTPWLSLAYVLIGATVLSYLLNLYALARVRSSTTAFYIYLQPLITACGAAWILGTPMRSEYMWAGLGLLIGGFLVLSRPKF